MFFHGYTGAMPGSVIIVLTARYRSSYSSRVSLYNYLSNYNDSLGFTKCLFGSFFGFSGSIPSLSCWFSRVWFSSLFFILMLSVYFLLFIFIVIGYCGLQNVSSAVVWTAFGFMAIVQVVAGLFSVIRLMSCFSLMVYLGTVAFDFAVQRGHIR